MRAPKKGKSADAYEKRFSRHLGDDLNTAQALAVLWEAAKDRNLSQRELLKFVKNTDSALGLDLLVRARKLAKEHALVPASIKKLGQERASLRKAEEFEKADKIRLRLAKLGYEIKDHGKGFEMQRIKK